MLNIKIIKQNFNNFNLWKVRYGNLIKIQLDGKSYKNLFNKCLKRWISEEIDGIRVYWDGNIFWTKHWKHLNSIPDIFIQKMPKIPLEGILR